MYKIALGAFLAVALLTGAITYNKDFQPDYDKMMSSVVRISVQDEKGEELGHGSGVILEDGNILSAAHVFEQKDDEKRQYMGKTKDGKYFKLEIIKKVAEKDLILVKPALNLAERGAKLKCEPLKVGDRVISMGSPMLLNWITTFGRVGGLRQPVAFMPYPIMITDAPLGPGMSGGPTFDINGNIVGINDAILTAPMKDNDMGFIGFSVLVPAEDACGIVDGQSA